jgi:hypothetical protein
MDEEEFDSLMRSRPFGRGDAMRADVQLRRRMMQALALRGRTLDDPQRQQPVQTLALYAEACSWPYSARRSDPTSD